MELTKLYHYVDQNTLTVGSGKLLAHQVDLNSKYFLCLFDAGLDENGEKQYDRIEDTLVFNTKGEAEGKLELVKPIIEEANKISEELNLKLKDKREQVIGKPKYEG